MSGHSTYLANAHLNWLKGTAMPTAPAALYVALFNGDPTDAGTGGTEVTTTIRTAGRVSVAPAGWSAISAKAITNTGVVDFGNAAGAATVTHFGVFDAVSAGNMLGSAALSSGSGSISAGTATNFAIGALTWGE
jgi:hypothetical protein